MCPTLVTPGHIAKEPNILPDIPAHSYLLLLSLYIIARKQKHSRYSSIDERLMKCGIYT